MWAPDKRNWNYNWVYGSGRMIYVGRGWAGNTMAQDSLSAEVRVLAWSTIDGAFERLCLPRDSCCCGGRLWAAENGIWCVCVSWCVCACFPSAPDFSSGLLDMSMGVSSFKEVPHGLGVVPEQVIVWLTPKYGGMFGTCVSRQSPWPIGRPRTGSTGRPRARRGRRRSSRAAPPPLPGRR